MQANQIAFNIAVALAMALGLSLGLNAILPGWLSAGIVVPLIGIMIIMMLLMGRSAAFGIIKTVAIWTWPFWIWGIARYSISISPITVLMPDDSMTRDQIINVSAPVIVSIAGWLFWRFARFQELARDVGVVLSLIVHAATISIAFINEPGMTREISAWAAASLAITFFLASSLYAPPATSYFKNSGLMTAGVAGLLIISLFIIPSKPLSEVMREKAHNLKDSLIEKAKEKSMDAKELIESKKEAAGRSIEKRSIATENRIFGIVNTPTIEPDAAGVPAE